MKGQANPETQNHAEENALFRAVLNDDKAILKLFLPPEIATLPPVHIALALKNHDLLSHLLSQSYVALEALDKQKRKPFYVAVEQGDSEAAQLLLERGARFSIRGIKGVSPLHLVAHQGNVAIVSELLKRGVDVDLRTIQKDTPLHFAAKAGQDSVISVLLEAGANSKAKNIHHQTPMELAMLEKHPKTLYLIEHAVYALNQSRLEQKKRLRILLKKESEAREHQAQVQQDEVLKFEQTSTLVPIKREIAALRKELSLNVGGLKSDLVGKLSQEKKKCLKFERSVPQKILSFSFALDCQYQCAKFLRLVAEGEQDKVETMLKGNPLLIRSRGRVTDLSGRTFENITGFQYATWALDRHMWMMLMEYLTTEEMAYQLQETGSWVNLYGLHAGLPGGPLQQLSAAIKNYVDHFREWNAEQWTQGFDKKVGSAQVLLPVHVINEYCRADRSFYPSPTFTELTLPRSRNTESGEWFSAAYNDCKVGDGFAFLRGDWNAACGVLGFWDGEGKIVSGFSWGPGGLIGVIDNAAIVKLTTVRVQELEALLSQLGIEQQASKSQRLYVK